MITTTLLRTIMENQWQHVLWKVHTEIKTSALTKHLPGILQAHQAANETTRLLLNALLLLNGGAIVAIPTIAPSVGVDRETLLYSGLSFFVGLLLALACGLASAYNFRRFATERESELEALLQDRRTVDRIASGAQAVDPGPEQKAKPNPQNTSLCIAWSTGVASLVAFAVGGSIILLSLWCATDSRMPESAAANIFMRTAAT